MKILYLANIRMPTDKAHGQQIMKMCEAFAVLGHEVELVVPRKKNSITADPFDYYPVKKIFRVHHLFIIDLISFGRFGFFISTLMYAVVARIYSWKHHADLIFTREPYLGILFSGHALELHDIPGRVRPLTKWLWKRPAAILVKTSFMREKLIGWGIRPDSILVSMNGVDVEAFSIPVSRDEARKKLSLPLDAKIALYSGTFFVHAWKGVDVLLQSYEFVSEGIVIVLVGGSEKDIGSISKRYPHDKVIARARTSNENIPLYLKSADVLVLPNTSGAALSEYYTSPLKLFEYMAANVPVVASDLPAIREAVDASEVEFVKPNDPKALAQGISAVCADPAAYQQKALKAHEKAKTLSWKNRAAATLDFARERMPVVKDTAFYDTESVNYSEKRYPRLLSSFIHYFFRARLDMTIAYLNRFTGPNGAADVLEIGCADGYVLADIVKEVPGIQHAVGIDLSPKMIEAAKRRGPDSISYFVRGKEPSARYDAIVEIGVANFTDLEKEIEYAHAHLKTGGHFILSLASNTSLKNRLNPKWSHQYAHLRSFNEYEKILSQSFEIGAVYSYGFDTPFIWRFPALARIIQPVIESCVRPLAPDLFHERLYVLSLRK